MSPVRQATGGAAQPQAPGQGQGRKAAIRLALAALAVPVLVFAGIRIYGTISEEFKKPQIPGQVRGWGRCRNRIGRFQRGRGTGAARSRVSVYRKGSDAPARAVVALGMPFGPQETTAVVNGRAGILQRELFRQAFLIAARDELGLLTRDEVLGERPGAAAAESPAPEIHTIPGVNGSFRVVIHAAEGAGDQPLFERDLTKTAVAADKSASADPTPEDLLDLAQKTEELSRTELVAVLRKLGLDGKPSATEPEGKVPEAIENGLSSLSFPDVFAAVKELHALIRSDGESPARLGALVRGYAILGVLTEFQWHPAHKAYKARRIVVRPAAGCPPAERPVGLWHRAFALALVGYMPMPLRTWARPNPWPSGGKTGSTVMGRAHLCARAM